MKIKWLGQSCFEIKSSDKTIVIDPYSSRIGSITLPVNLTADILLVTHQHHDHNNIEAVGGDPKIVNTVGEDDLDGVKITGIASFHDNENGAQRGQNIVFVVEVDGLRICHLGDLGHLLSDKQLEKIGAIDVLFIPVGGYYTIGPKEAGEVVGQIKPKIVVPMHYKVTPELPGPLGGVDDFAKELGLEPAYTRELAIEGKPDNTTPKLIILTIEK